MAPSHGALVNHYYFYAVDDDFGPFFLKFCSYFPYNAKLCINGHEYLKRQLTKRGIAFEPLDNGIRSCADPETMQRLADGLTADKIDALLRKWLALLPHPFAAGDREQGIRYDISILQAEFARTEVFDRPMAGRVFFEEVVRENLDMGRPDHVQLIFNRRVNRRTPTRYRTRVITDGVIPSLHVDYKHSRIKQYHKEGRALRTETVINDTYDFDIGRRLKNLDDLKQIGFAANRRLLGVQRLSHDCTIGVDVLDALHRPAHIDGQRASALRFGDPRVQALVAALLRFDLLPAGFRNRQLREAVAPLRGMSLDDYNAGQMTYDLRRLRLRGLIERIPHSQRYRLTAEGLCIALAYHRTQARVLGPVLSATLDGVSAVLLDPDVGDAGPDCCQPCRRRSLREDQSDLANWTRGDRMARFEQTAERHAGLSQFAAPFLTRMKFVDEQGEGVSPTLSALRVYREHRAAGRCGLPPDAPLDFAPTALQPLIRRDGVTDRRRWESTTEVNRQFLGQDFHLLDDDALSRRS